MRVGCLVAIAALLLGLQGACSDPQQLPGDLGPTDIASSDRAADLRRDGGAADAFTPLPGLGTLAGACGVLDDAEWSSSSPFLFRNVLDLGAADFDTAKLSPGGLTIWTEGNLGGSSIHSEVFAFEVLHRCELAKLLKTEGKVDYKDAAGKKTDVLTEIDARAVGVSVTRAYHYPPGAPYTEAEAKSLLEKKLADLPLSQANAVPADAWTRSILHVFAYDPQHADTIEAAWSQVGAAVKGAAILMVTVTEGNDSYMY